MCFVILCLCLYSACYLWFVPNTSVPYVLHHFNPIFPLPHISSNDGCETFRIHNRKKAWSLLCGRSQNANQHCKLLGNQRTDHIMLLLPVYETFTTLKASSSALNWLKCEIKGHKHSVIKGQTSWRDISSFHEAQRNKFVTPHHNIHIHQSRKADMRLLFWAETHADCIKMQY